MTTRFAASTRRSTIRSERMPVGIILGLCGLAGLVNQVYVILKQFKMNIATLDWLDWALFSAVPALGYASLIAGAAGLIAEKSFAPYAIAGAITLLLFAGIFGHGTSRCGSPGTGTRPNDEYALCEFGLMRLLGMTALGSIGAVGRPAQPGAKCKILTTSAYANARRWAWDAWRLRACHPTTRSPRKGACAPTTAHRPSSSPLRQRVR